MVVNAGSPGKASERVDARRNRQLLLGAAAACVAEKGTAVAALDIAERAGVSVATLYRRFTTKDALIELVLVELLEQLNNIAMRSLANPDAWTGLSEFIVAFARMNKDNHGLSQALGFQETEALATPQKRLRDAIRNLTQRAQRAGLIRSDITWQDIAFLPKANPVHRFSIGLVAGDEEWERCLTLTLDGLRTTTPTPLPGAAPPDPDAAG